MFDMAIVVSALVFCSILLLLLGGFYHLKYRREHAGLVEKVKTGGLATRAGDIVPDAPETGNSMKDVFLKTSIWAGKMARSKESDADLSQLRKLFLNAGIRHSSASAVFWGAEVLCAAALPALAFFLLAFSDTPLLQFHLLAVLGALALLGFYLPVLYLKLMIRRRQDRIVKGFPDALDLLVVCVEAGMGLDAAISRVADEIRLSNQVISDEFKTLNLELRAGKSRIDALRNLGMRTGVEEVRSFTTLLVQTDRFGTSVAQALRVHSDSMRVQRYQRAEELAGKLPVKLMIPLIFFIFPSIFVIIVGPAAIQIYHTIVAR
jgi:tight adherence protein C